MSALAIKFYDHRDNYKIKPKLITRFVSKRKRFHLGEMAFFPGEDFVGYVSGIGMEGKSLAIHLHPMNLLGKKREQYYDF